MVIYIYIYDMDDKRLTMIRKMNSKYKHYFSEDPKVWWRAGEVNEDIGNICIL